MLSWPQPCSCAWCTNRPDNMWCRIALGAKHHAGQGFAHSSRQLRAQRPAEGPELGSKKTWASSVVATALGPTQPLRLLWVAHKKPRWFWNQTRYFFSRVGYGCHSGAYFLAALPNPHQCKSGPSCPVAGLGWRPVVTIPHKASLQSLLPHISLAWLGWLTKRQQVTLTA